MIVVLPVKALREYELGERGEHIKGNWIDSIKDVLHAQAKRDLFPYLKKKIHIKKLFNKMLYIILL